jgi:hypothetical protein
MHVSLEDDFAPLIIHIIYQFTEKILIHLRAAGHTVGA